MGYRTEGIRNLCLVGHTGTGKTTLAESLLFAGDHSRLKSLSGGEGSFTMVFSRYVPVAAKVQSELKAAYRPREDA